jgi:hypothetical protein
MILLSPLITEQSSTHSTLKTPQKLLKKQIPSFRIKGPRHILAKKRTKSKYLHFQTDQDVLLWGNIKI